MITFAFKLIMDLRREGRSEKERWWDWRQESPSVAAANISARS